MKRQGVYSQLFDEQDSAEGRKYIIDPIFHRDDGKIYTLDNDLLKQHVEKTDQTANSTVYNGSVTQQGRIT